MRVKESGKAGCSFCSVLVSSRLTGLVCFQLNTPLGKVANVAVPIACWSLCLSLASSFLAASRVCRTRCRSAKAWLNPTSWHKSTVSPSSLGNSARNAASAESEPSAGGGVSLSTYSQNCRSKAISWSIIASSRSMRWICSSWPPSSTATSAACCPVTANWCMTCSCTYSGTPSFHSLAP